MLDALNFNIRSVNLAVGYFKLRLMRLVKDNSFGCI